jgi:hypothetical protein
MGPLHVIGQNGCFAHGATPLAMGVAFGVKDRTVSEDIIM